MKIEISHKTIFFIVGIIGVLWISYLIREVILLVFVSAVLTAAFHPIVSYFEKFKISRFLSIVIFYLLMIGVGTVLVLLIVTPLGKETSELTIQLPNTLEKLIPNTDFLEQTNLPEQLKFISQSVFDFSLSILSNLLAFFFVLVITFYLLLERDKLDHLITQYFAGKEQRIIKTVHEIENKLGFWARGQIILCLNVGVLTYIALSLLGIPYALPLAILSGVMEAIPFIGSLISAIPAVLIALTISPTQALLTGLAFLAIQQVQNNFVIPQVMKIAIGLNPLVILLAITIGGELSGITGTLLAIPITVTLQLIIREVLKEKVA